MKTIYGLFCVLVFLGSCAGTDKDSTSSKSGEDHTSNPETTESVTVYSHRHYDIDKEIFSAFEKET
ncbi:MAG: Fe(3+) ABC transporter substrate-binding protein, partial [Crocinitomicaceae bacterium]|nr:Fe(3+) ABC transporter substrate-binding protein [Crocinitomicaceae bacterium]